MIRGIVIAVCLGCGMYASAINTAINDAYMQAVDRMLLELSDAEVQQVAKTAPNAARSALASRSLAFSVGQYAYAGAAVVGASVVYAGFDWLFRTVQQQSGFPAVDEWGTQYYNPEQRPKHDYGCRFSATITQIRKDWLFPSEIYYAQVTADGNTCYGTAPLFTGSQPLYSTTYANGECRWSDTLCQDAQLVTARQTIAAGYTARCLNYVARCFATIGGDGVVSFTVAPPELEDWIAGNPTARVPEVRGAIRNLTNRRWSTADPSQPTPDITVTPAPDLDAVTATNPPPPPPGGSTSSEGVRDDLANETACNALSSTGVSGFIQRFWPSLVLVGRCMFEPQVALSARLQALRPQIETKFPFALIAQLNGLNTSISGDWTGQAATPNLPSQIGPFTLDWSPYYDWFALVRTVFRALSIYLLFVWLLNKLSAQVVING